MYDEAEDRLRHRGQASNNEVSDFPPMQTSSLAAMFDAARHRDTGF